MVNLNVGKCQNKKTICISTALSDISLCLYIRSWAVTMFSLSLTIIALASGTLFTTLTSATRLKLNCDNSQSLLVIVFARESFIEFRSERCMRHTFAWSRNKTAAESECSESQLTAADECTHFLQYWPWLKYNAQLYSAGQTRLGQYSCVQTHCPLASHHPVRAARPSTTVLSSFGYFLFNFLSIR